MNAASTDSGIDGGRVIVAIGAALLFASLFVDWYGFGRGVDLANFDEAQDTGVTAWTAFELVDLLLALLSITAIAAALEPFVRTSSRIPAGFTAAAGPAALLLVVVSIINEPPAAQGFDSQLEVGAWLALAGAAIMCAGALLAGNRISLVVTPRERGTEAPSGDAETRPL